MRPIDEVLKLTSHEELGAEESERLSIHTNPDGWLTPSVVMDEVRLIGERRRELIKISGKWF